MSIKQFIVSAVAVLGMGFMGQASAYDYQQVKGDMMQSRIYTLKNGLTVYMSVNKEKPRIQTYIAVRTGSRNDPHETTGLPTISNTSCSRAHSSLVPQTTRRSCPISTTLNAATRPTAR